MNQQKIMKILDELEKSRPIIKLVRGINNKETYYNSEALYAILEKVKP